METVYIPRFLDQEEQLMFFSLREFIGFLGIFMGGMMLGIALIGLIFGVLYVVGLRYAESKGLGDILMYVAYWYLPKSLLTKLSLDIHGLPPSHFRVMTG